MFTKRKFLFCLKGENELAKVGGGCNLVRGLLE
jgi:hypothetical protein